MGRRNGVPNVKAIAEANKPLIARLSDVYAATAHATCWACRYQTRGFIPERAHVIGLANGGSNEPGNFFLLCSLCHREQPDGAGREEQEEWLIDHEGHEDRFRRDWQPVCDAVMAKARAAGGEDLVSLYLAEVGAEGIRTAYVDGVNRSCSHSAETQMANGRRGVIQSFTAWLGRRSASHGPASVDIAAEPSR